MPVTLLGTSFSTDITSIKLHDVAVMGYTRVSSTEIRVISGSRASAASGPAVVTTVSTGAGSGVSYTYNPIPSIGAATPSVGPRAGGTNVTITGSNLGNNDITTVLFGTAASTAVTWVSATKVLAVSPTSSVSTSVSVQLSSLLFGSSTTVAGLYTYAPGTILPQATCLSHATYSTIHHRSGTNTRTFVWWIHCNRHWFQFGQQ